MYVGLGAPFIDVADQTNAATLGVRITARRYLAVATLWPAAVVVMSGTGLAAAS